VVEAAEKVLQHQFDVVEEEEGQELLLNNGLMPLPLVQLKQLQSVLVEMVEHQQPPIVQTVQLEHKVEQRHLDL
jgi:hypothetical protein